MKLCILWDPVICLRKRKCNFFPFLHLFFIIRFLIRNGSLKKICKGLWRILRYKTRNQALHRSILTSRKPFFFIALHFVCFSAGQLTQHKLHAGVKCACVWLGAGPVSRWMLLNSNRTETCAAVGSSPWRRSMHHPRCHTHTHLYCTATHSQTCRHDCRARTHTQRR